MDLRRVFDYMISVSELGRGQASKVIQAVEDEGNPYIVVKNNKPQAVIISIKEYSELIHAKEFLESMGYTLPPTSNDSSAPKKSAGVRRASSGTGSLSEDEMSFFLEKEEND